MHLSGCLIIVTFLSSGVSAFYPYTFNHSREDTGSGKLESRFNAEAGEIKDVVQDGDSVVVTLPLKKAPKPVSTDLTNLVEHYKKLNAHV
jgi:hypothetical protein